MTRFRPGDLVVHRVQQANGDQWVGMITAVISIEYQSSTTHEVRVRWIKPCGDPSEGTTTHDPQELLPAPRE